VRQKDYIIEFNKLRKGVNEFTFAIDDKFLSEIEGEHPLRADVKVDMQLLRSETMYDLKFQLAGKARLMCDVCLEEFEMPLNGNFHLFMKISEVENYSDDEIIFIQPNLIEYDLTQYLFESFMLSLPVKKVCNMGGKECNPEVLKKLEELKSEDIDDQKNNDPRWDKLKGIFNNN
jgi:uncharacterized protein